MSRTDWPSLATITGCAQLFTDVGHPIDRSNLSRWIAGRNFAGKLQGKRTLYDPNALFDAWSTDFGRNVMAGKTGNVAQDLPQLPSAGDAPAERAGSAGDPFPAAGATAKYDPKFDIASLNARKLQREVAEQEGRTLPAEEVAAQLAECIAELRAAFSRKAPAEAARLLKDLNLPGHLQGVLTAGLKRYAIHGQEAFAAAAAELLGPSSTPGTPARARLDALVAFDLELRSEKEVGA